MFTRYLRSHYLSQGKTPLSGWYLSKQSALWRNLRDNQQNITVSGCGSNGWLSTWLSYVKNRTQPSLEPRPQSISTSRCKARKILHRYNNLTLPPPPTTPRSSSPPPPPPPPPTTTNTSAAASRSVSTVQWSFLTYSYVFCVGCGTRTMANVGFSSEVIGDSALLRLIGIVHWPLKMNAKNMVPITL